MFVLFLASVNWASANPVYTECGNSTADSASKTVSACREVIRVSRLTPVIYSERSSKKPVTLFNCGSLMISFSEWCFFGSS